MGSWGRRVMRPARTGLCVAALPCARTAGSTKTVSGKPGVVQLGYKMGSCLTDVTSSARHIFRRRSPVSHPPVHHRVKRRALP